MNGLALVKTCPACKNIFTPRRRQSPANFASQIHCSKTCGLARRMLTPWTPERDAALREMRNAGYSSQQIAEKLGGTSRNAVIGRAGRLGLAAVTKSATTRKARKRAREQSLMPAEPIAKGISLAELTSTTCRWPHGHPGEPGFGFCGTLCKPLDPYCDAHMARAYTKTLERGEYVRRTALTMRAGAMR